MGKMCMKEAQKGRPHLTKYDKIKSNISLLKSTYINNLGILPETHIITLSYVWSGVKSL